MIANGMEFFYKNECAMDTNIFPVATRLEIK